MRISSLASLLLLAACGGKAGTEGESVAAKADAATVVCRVDGEPEFAPHCTLHQAAGASGPVWTVTGPTGGFRRFLVSEDGRTLRAADGAEPAVVTPIGPDMIEVLVANDRYRLPVVAHPAERTPR